MDIEVALSDFTMGLSSEITLNGAFLQEKPHLAKAGQDTVIVKPL
jgi:hypothetical protein